MSPTNIVLLLEGKDYEQETLAKASRLAQGLGANLTLLHLTHSSKTRRNSLSLSQEERSPRAPWMPRRSSVNSSPSCLIRWITSAWWWMTWCRISSAGWPPTRRPLAGRQPSSLDGGLAGPPAPLQTAPRYPDLPRASRRLAQSRRLTPQDPLPERVFLFLTPRRHPPQLDLLHCVTARTTRFLTHCSLLFEGHLLHDMALARLRSFRSGDK